MTTISAKSILASRHAQSGNRIDTLLLRYPRWIHAEGRTHRVLDISEDFEVSVPTPSLMECDDLSRNASSSRAIPVNRLIQDVIDDPAVPLFWGKNQKGMQAGEENDAPVRVSDKEYALWPRGDAWLQARDNAVYMAQQFSNAGYHKQIVNRLLEPFSHITVVVTATEWSNFFALRDHPDAEPHIQMLARAMKEAMAGARVKTLNPGDWHLPFTDDYEIDEWEQYGIKTVDAIKLSVARCASTSYKTVDGFDMTLERAIELHDKLVVAVPMHASPAEHQACADLLIPHGHGCDGPMTSWKNPTLHGNLKGFIQYRKTLKGECQ